MKRIMPNSNVHYYYIIKDDEKLKIIFHSNFNHIEVLRQLKRIYQKVESSTAFDDQYLNTKIMRDKDFELASPKKFIDEYKNDVLVRTNR